jgi:LemA protein
MKRGKRDNVETEQGGEMMATPITLRPRWPVLLSLLAALLLSGCGVNTIPTLDEQVKAAWSQVLNQYQRRADLIPNLVETVRGYAAQERETLTAVVEARAKATQTQIPPDILTNPEAFQRFQQNQDALSGALSRLLVVVERYPDLKSNQNFLQLQAQLEGTENRITVARKRFIDSVAEYNKVVLRFPTSIGAGMRGKKERPTFTGAAADEKPPEINL